MKYSKGLALIRMIIGLLLIYHGYDVFNTEQMSGNAKWMYDLHYPFPTFFAFAGKAAEFVGGLSLLLGYRVRLFTIHLVVTLLLITFTMGHGKIFTDDQHPFLFALICAVYFFLGSGEWSLDEYMEKEKKK